MIESANYLKLFQETANHLDQKLLKETRIEVAVVEVLNCVALKLYKRSWANLHEEPLTARSRIFFSIWMSDDVHNEQKIFYNIHALKLRELRGYKIESKKFAELFRSYFKPLENQWPNVSLKFGPLTLMEGWVKTDADNFKHEVLKLASNFLKISQLVDDTLVNFSKKQ
ncbi:hypothetical protein [Pedobacter sp. NJ-S-72]